MKLHQLLEHLPFYTLENDANPNITSIEMDHRKVEEGNLFVCIKGAKFNSHEFIDEIVSNGAKAIVATEPINCDLPIIYVKDVRRVLAILSDAFYGHPTKSLHLVGVTGTNGKTTVSHLVESIFNKNQINSGIIGTIGMKMNQEVIEVNNTTPESPVLQKTFRKMLDTNIEAVVMEVSSHALDMGRVRGCDFDIAIFTNLTQDHLDYHQNMEEYRAAKGLLFSQLGNTYDNKHPKYAILNGDDKASDYFAKITSSYVVTYGIDSRCDVTAKDIQISGQGTSFKLVTPNEEIVMHINLVGKFNVYNVLAAITAGIASKIPIHVIVDALQEVTGVPGRFELVDVGQSYPVIVDYSHTPDSLENVLKTVNEFAEGDVYVVVGCGGDRDKSKRPQMASIAVDNADFAIFTSDNPRTEDPEDILDDMKRGLKNTNYKSIVDRKQAIEYAISCAKEKDVVLIAGKGHETYQIIGDKINDFDDREIARNAILVKQKRVDG